MSVREGEPTNLVRAIGDEADTRIARYVRFHPSRKIHHLTLQGMREELRHAIDREHWFLAARLFARIVEVTLDA